MGANGYQGQIRAKDQANKKFIAGQELMSLIRSNAAVTVNYIQRIGIIAPPKTLIKINNVVVQVGSTHIYELNDVNITSLMFIQDSTEDAIIDFIIK